MEINDCIIPLKCWNIAFNDLASKFCKFLPKICFSKFWYPIWMWMLCIENEEESDYQWSGTKASITDRIGIIYIESLLFGSGVLR